MSRDGALSHLINKPEECKIYEMECSDDRETVMSAKGTSVFNYIVNKMYVWFTLFGIPWMAIALT